MCRFQAQKKGLPEGGRKKKISQSYPAVDKMLPASPGLGSPAKIIYLTP
jgi:hypothetical protein